MKNNYKFLSGIFNFINSLYEQIRFKYYLFWDIIIISIWLIFFLIGYITIQKLFLFFIILCVILIYKKLYKLTYNYDFNHSFYKYIITNDTTFYILLNIVSLISCIPFIILSIELQLYNLINFLNEKIKMFNFNKFFWILIFSVLILPSILIISRFYKLLGNFNNLTMYKIFCKRAFGSILSVIIFSDIIRLLITITGNYIFLYLYLYLLLSLICFFDYFLNILKIWDKLKLELNIFLLIENKKKNSICYNIITKLWNNKMLEHEVFMQVFGNKLNIACFFFLNIYSYNIQVISKKITIINNVNFIFNKKNILSTLLINDIKFNLSSLCDNFVVLEYYNLVKDDIENLHILKNSAEIRDQIDSLYIFYYNAIKLLLFFIWDLEKQVGSVISSELDLDKTDLGHVIFNLYDKFIFNKVDYSVIFENDISDNELIVLLYEISLLDLNNELWLVSCNRLFNNNKYSSVFYASLSFQQQLYNSFEQYANNLIELLMRIRCGGFVLNKNKLEKCLESRLINYNKKIYKEWLDQSASNNILGNLENRIKQLYSISIFYQEIKGK